MVFLNDVFGERVESAVHGLAMGGCSDLFLLLEFFARVPPSVVPAHHFGVRVRVLVPNALRVIGRDLVHLVFGQEVEVEKLLWKGLMWFA